MGGGGLLGLPVLVTALSTSSLALLLDPPVASSLLLPPLEWLLAPAPCEGGTGTAAGRDGGPPGWRLTEEWRCVMEVECTGPGAHGDSGAWPMELGCRGELMGGLQSTSGWRECDQPASTRLGTCAEGRREAELTCRLGGPPCCGAPFLPATAVAAAAAAAAAAASAAEVDPLLGDADAVRETADRAPAMA